MNRSHRPLRRGLAALALAGLALALPSAQGAQAGGPARSLAIAWSAQEGAGPVGETARAQRSDLRLLAGWETEDGGRMAGLTIRLDDGWKTYWRVPGDAGIPPEFDWSGSENVASVEVLWPRPVAFDLFGMTTLGYKQEVTLPLKAVPVDPAKPMVLRLSLAYGVCADICMPEMAEVALPLGGAPNRGLAPIEAALAALPESPASTGARLAGCRLTGEGDARRLEASLRLPSPPRGPLLAVVEGPEPLWFEPAALTAAPDLGRDAMRLSARLDPASGAAWLDRTALRVTVLGADRAVAFEGCEG
ncbi:protein-disulfide reductase DsbD domain-containing protein [Albimonas pacifica]|uniref:Thiol-disulfide interchange protein, contains DsbC and DsbD domains n=1 Tax=Albimonas pacifica TaxID=1114924 RepID=A0A1I3KNK5_9RHOB|nr:protein-disulfide reductase DsbD domain-containing protein [Albimonas pacifica]SFI74082.1 Thiol-disulfide interchange protein, contains DsbC and DsbD domains [Albimonas pacifica]